MSAAVTTSTKLAIVRPRDMTRPSVRTRRPRTWHGAPNHQLARTPQDDALIGRLREQITRLAQHYANDMSRIHGRLAEAHAGLERERIATMRAMERSVAAEAETKRMSRRLGMARLELQRERERADRLQEATQLPWWAFVRRRELLDAPEPQGS